MKNFVTGEMVMFSRGKVGMVASDSLPNDKFVEIQLGTDGPFKKVRRSFVRHATRAEIRAAGLEGVGHVPPPLK